MSAHQRFVTRHRTRVVARMRRARLMLLLVAPLMLTSCVTQIVQRPPVVPIAASPEPVPIVAIGPQAPILAIPALAMPTAPSMLAGLGQRDRMRATLCLASAIYYEAATEPDEGQRAVAQVVLNRVRHPAWPNTVCGVVYQGSYRPGCQFSFACDGAMARAPMLAAWIRSRRVAENALAGEVYDPVGGATFYHTLQVAPAWRSRLNAVAIVGAHIFYRQPADPLDPRLFPVRYLGGEPTPGPLPRVAPLTQLMQVTTIAPLVPRSPIYVVSAVPSTKPASHVTTIAPSSDDRYVAGALPDSDILPQYRHSGEAIAR